MDHLLPNSQNIEKCILFQLAPLKKAVIVHRPSKTCQSPYVADIILEGNNEPILAHSPSLGCSGLCSNNKTVLVQPSNNIKGKCRYRILLSQVKLGENAQNKKYTYVSTHPRLAEDVVKYSLKLDIIEQLKGHRRNCIKEQISFGNSRFDFAGIGASGRPFLLEVKSVPLADFEDITTKERQKRDYTDWDTLSKVAYFPDGYRKNKKDVISPRALKHIQELEAIYKKGDIDTYLCFVIQRSDVSRFVVSCLDPIYKKAIKKAIKSGVVIITLQCDYDDKGYCRLINQELLDMSCFDETM